MGREVVGLLVRLSKSALELGRHVGSGGLEDGGEVDVDEVGRTLWGDEEGEGGVLERFVLEEDDLGLDDLATTERKSGESRGEVLRGGRKGDLGADVDVEAETSILRQS